MSLEGDFDKLAALGKKLTQEATKAIMPALETQALDLYQKSFSQQQGPIGGPWPESPNSMYVTGELANPEISVSDKQLEVKAPPHYARFHQGGWETGGQRVKIAVSSNIRTRKEKKRTVRIGGTQAGPARPVLPTNSTAGEWDAPLKTTIDEGVRKFFGDS